MAGEAEFLSGTDVKTALVKIYGVGLRAFQYVDIDGRARVEGCIDIGATPEVEEQTKVLRNNPQAAKNKLETFGAAIKEIRFRWKNKTVPFTIDAQLPQFQARRRCYCTLAGQNTDPDSFKRTNEQDFVTFRAGSGCSSSVGRQGGQQFVGLLARNVRRAIAFTRLVTLSVFGMNKAALIVIYSFTSISKISFGEWSITSFNMSMTASISEIMTTVPSCITLPMRSRRTVSPLSCPGRPGDWPAQH